MATKAVLRIAAIAAVATLFGCDKTPKDPANFAREFGSTLTSGKSAEDYYCYKPDYPSFSQQYQTKSGEAVSVVGVQSGPPPNSDYPQSVSQISLQIGDDQVPLVIWPTDDFKTFLAEQYKFLNLEMPSASAFSEFDNCAMLVPSAAP
ncbi:MAG TPA: hypothetical protein V6D07_19035 [Trichocoleus sp.]